MDLMLKMAYGLLIVNGLVQMFQGAFLLMNSDIILGISSVCVGIFSLGAGLLFIDESSDKFYEYKGLGS